MDLPTPTFRPTGDVPAADASVREATAVDASTVGAVQDAAWRASYADVLPGQSLAALEP